MTSKFNNAHNRVITGGTTYAVNAWHPVGYHSTEGGKRKTKSKRNQGKTKSKRNKGKPKSKRNQGNPKSKRNKGKTKSKRKK